MQAQPIDEHAVTMHRRARTHASTGDLGKAEAEYRGAIALAPTYPLPHFDLAVLLEQKGSDPQESVRHYLLFEDLASTDLRLARLVDEARTRRRALEGPVEGASPPLPPPAPPPRSGNHAVH